MIYTVLASIYILYKGKLYCKAVILHFEIFLAPPLVTEFPAAYYTLTKPEDFNNLLSDDEEDKYKQVTKDKDEYNTTTEYVAVMEYEHNTKYDHNNNVKSVAMFHARRAVMFQARIAVTFQARSATRLTSLTTNLSLRQT